MGRAKSKKPKTHKASRYRGRPRKNNRTGNGRKKNKTVKNRKTKKHQRGGSAARSAARWETREPVIDELQAVIDELQEARNSVAQALRRGNSTQSVNELHRKVNTLVDKLNELHKRQAITAETDDPLFGFEDP